jgi:long-chain fatty acid transport protein
MTLHRVKRLLFVSAALVGLPAALSAQGFGLVEIGSCAIGRASAATGSPCKDASTIYWNAAAATQLTGFNITAGAAAIAISSRFTQDTTGRSWDGAAPTAVVPHVFLNYHKPTSKLAYGLGVYIPYGLTSEWTDDFPGRFQAKRASLATVYVQPNIAYQINSKWSIGGGPVWGHSSVELIQAIDLSEQNTPTPGVRFSQLGIATGTEFARAKLEGSSTAFGAQIAIFGQPTAAWSFGLRFLTPIDFKYDGADATFTQTKTNLIVGGNLSATLPAGTKIDDLVAPQFASGGNLVAQNVSTRITHPAQIQGGVGYSGYKNWLLEADVAWVGWRVFNTLPVDFTNNALDRTLIENYNNSTAIRLGAEYTIPTDGWKLRAGFMGIASAAPAETVTPLLPEQDRAYWTFGASVPFMTRYGLDVGYMHVSAPGARGRIGDRTLTQSAEQVNSGVYDLSANVFSLTLRPTSNQPPRRPSDVSHA